MLSKLQIELFSSSTHHLASQPTSQAISLINYLCIQGTSGCSEAFQDMQCSTLSTCQVLVFRTLLHNNNVPCPLKSSIARTSPVYTRVLTWIQPGFASNQTPNPDCNPGIDSTHIHWWIGTRFATRSELNLG